MQTVNEFALVLTGAFLGIVGTLVFVQRHTRRICALLDEFFEDEVVAPLRKTDAPRAYRLQSVYRTLLQRLEQLI